MRLNRLRQRGDTILEVMICLVVIAGILTAAFALTNRNTVSAQKAQERTNAVKVAEAQTELLKALADVEALPAASTIFCLKQDAAAASGVTKVMFTDPSLPGSTAAGDSGVYPADCLLDNNPNDDLYRVAIWSPDKATAINSDTTAKPYGITVRWGGLGGGDEEFKTFYSIYGFGDPGFSVSGPPPAVCNDGIDNDGDGKIDFGNAPSNDSGCTSATDPSEVNAECNDGIDNDGDGLKDFGNGPLNDPGCNSLTDNDEFNAGAPFNWIKQGKDYLSCTIPSSTNVCNPNGQVGNAMQAHWNFEAVYDGASAGGVKAGSAVITIQYTNVLSTSNLAPLSPYTYQIRVTVGTDSPIIYNLPTTTNGVIRSFDSPINIVNNNPFGNAIPVKIEWLNDYYVSPYDANFQLESIRIKRD